MREPASPPDPAERLGKNPLAVRIGVILVGVALVVAAVVIPVVVGKDLGVWISVPLLILGAGILWLGARSKSSYYSPEGLRRVGFTGEEVVPWDQVETIELDLIPSRYEDGGWVRLRLLSGKRIAIPSEPADVDDLGVRLSGICPHAFVDDRRTGEVTPPSTGEAGAIERREAALRERAATSHFRAGIGWTVCGVILALCTVMSGAMLFISSNPLEAVGALFVCGVGTWVGFSTASHKFQLARVLREDD